MKKCGKQCHACPYIIESKEVKSVNYKPLKWQLRNNLSCESSNIVYLIQCMKDNCNEQYIGESKRAIKDRLGDHKGYIRNYHVNQPTGAHFNKPGHLLSDMKIIILEKVKKMDDQYRKEREKYFIKKFNTYYKGINQKP